MMVEAKVRRCHTWEPCVSYTGEISWYCLSSLLFLSPERMMGVGRILPWMYWNPVTRWESNKLDQYVVRSFETKEASNKKKWQRYVVTYHELVGSAGCSMSCFFAVVTDIRLGHAPLFGGKVTLIHPVVFQKRILVSSR